MSASNHPLCLRCGLCCDGTLFRAVELLPGDRPATLRELGLPIRRRDAVHQFPQPCAALGGCHCRIYPDRPSHCRKFDCRVLQRSRNGLLTPLQALRRVAKARRLAAEVRRLLGVMGEVDERAPIKLRFERTMRDVESGGGGRGGAASSSALGLAMHQLVLLLAAEFYVEGETPTGR